MSVKTKFIVLGLVLILIFLMRLIVSRQQDVVDLSTLIELQQEHHSNTLDRLIELDGSTLAFLTRDNSEWDDMVDYVSEKGASGIEDVLRSLIASDNLDAVWVYHKDGHLVYYAGQHDEDSIKDIRSFTTDPFSSLFSSQNELHFFILTSENVLFEIRGSLIHPAVDPDRLTTSQGYLFTGRRWDQDYLTRLSNSTGGTMRLVPVEDEKISIESTSQIVLHRRFSTWDDQLLPVMLEARFPNKNFDVFAHIQDRAAISFILFFLLLLAILLTAFYAWILNPLGAISRSMSESRLDPVRKILSRRDEMGYLARLIQKSFEQQSEVDLEIKRRKEIEAALRTSEEAYRAVVDHSIQGLAILQSGRIVFSNPALANDMGYSVDELLSFSEAQVQQRLHPADQGLMFERIRQCSQEGVEQHFEARIFRKDGTICWMEVFANRVEFLGHSAVQIANLDITNRKIAEQAYHQEQAFALAILNTVNSLVLVLDPGGKIVRCNPACERAGKFSLESVKGKFFWELLGAEVESGAFKTRFLNLVESRTTLQREDHVHLPNGLHFWISWSNSFLLDMDNEVQYVVVAGIDVTDRIQRERQQEAIAALSSELRGFLTRKQTLHVILEQMIRFLHAEVLVAIGIIRPESEQVVIEAAQGLYAENLVNWTLPMGEGVSGEVLRRRQPYLSNCLSDEPRLLRTDLFDKISAAAWIPLVVEGGPVGLILVGSREPINESDFRLLVAIADVAAGAIHRCVLSDETQRRLQRLSALHTINIAVSASLDIRVTLSVLVNQITTQLGVDAADILLIDPITRDLIFAAGHGFRSRELERAHLWLGEGRAGQVAMDRKSMHLYEPKGIAGVFLPSRKFLAEDFIAYDAVPLTIKGEIKGVLETFRRSPYEPDPEWLQFLEALATETAIAINNADLLDKLQRNNLDLALAYDATIEGWALALEMRDRITEGHTRRVAEWSIHLAQALKIGSEELIHMRRGSLLHDIGKMAIPDDILNKPGPLTEDEWTIMRKHPEYAYQMLSSIPFLRAATAIPYSHHERWDGSGYPQGLSGKQIPLAARIFAVVDVWDALYFGRLYRKPMAENEVLSYLQQEAGRLFDPDVVSAFVEVRRLSNLAG